MTLFLVLIVAVLMSVCFTCLCKCNSSHRKLRRVGNFNRYVVTYQLVNHIRARRSNACFRVCRITLQSSRTQLHFRHRVPCIQFWLDRERLVSAGTVGLSRGVPASQAYVERLFSPCGDLTARKQNNTKYRPLKGTWRSGHVTITKKYRHT